MEVFSSNEETLNKNQVCLREQYEKLIRRRNKSSRQNSEISECYQIGDLRRQHSS